MVIDSVAAYTKKAALGDLLNVNYPEIPESWNFGNKKARYLYQAFCALCFHERAYTKYTDS